MSSIAQSLVLYNQSSDHTDYFNPGQLTVFNLKDLKDTLSSGFDKDLVFKERITAMLHRKRLITINNVVAPCYIE